jgi:hypothetical protein
MSPNISALPFNVALDGLNLHPVPRDPLSYVISDAKLTLVLVGEVRCKVLQRIVGQHDLSATRQLIYNGFS